MRIHRCEQEERDKLKAVEEQSAYGDERDARLETGGWWWYEIKRGWKKPSLEPSAAIAAAPQAPICHICPDGLRAVLRSEQQQHRRHASPLLNLYHHQSLQQCYWNS